MKSQLTKYLKTQTRQIIDERLRPLSQRHTMLFPYEVFSFSFLVIPVNRHGTKVKHTVLSKGARLITQKICYSTQFLRQCTRPDDSVKCFYVVQEEVIVHSFHRH